jgi:hypothetical protein
MINTKKIILQLYLIDENFRNHLKYNKITSRNLKTTLGYLEQRGGSTKQIKVNYNGEEFIFENPYGDLVYFLYSIDGKDGMCLIISINQEDKIANINNLNADTLKCGDTIMDNQGTHLLKVGIKFLIENKHKFKINSIRLKDNAYINCRTKKLNKPIQINLSSFLLLTKGYTFYGKYGFEPLDENYKKLEYRLIKKLKKLKIENLEFDKIIKFIYKKNKKYNYIKTIHIDKFKEYYENFKDKYYYDFMSNYFHKNNPSSCIIFDLMKNELIYRIKKNSSIDIDIKHNITRELIL